MQSNKIKNKKNNNKKNEVMGYTVFFWYLSMCLVYCISKEGEQKGRLFHIWES